MIKKILLSAVILAVGCVSYIALILAFTTTSYYSCAGTLRQVYEVDRYTEPYTGTLTVEKAPWLVAPLKMLFPSMFVYKDRKFRPYTLSFSGDRMYVSTFSDGAVFPKLLGHDRPVWEQTVIFEMAQKTITVTDSGFPDYTLVFEGHCTQANIAR